MQTSIVDLLVLQNQLAHVTLVTYVCRPHLLLTQLPRVVLVEVDMSVLPVRSASLGSALRRAPLGHSQLSLGWLPPANVRLASAGGRVRVVKLNQPKNARLATFANWAPLPQHQPTQPRWLIRTMYVQSGMSVQSARPMQCSAPTDTSLGRLEAQRAPFAALATIALTGRLSSRALLVRIVLKGLVWMCCHVLSDRMVLLLASLLGQIVLIVRLESTVVMWVCQLRLATVLPGISVPRTPIRPLLKAIVTHQVILLLWLESALSDIIALKHPMSRFRAMLGRMRRRPDLLRVLPVLLDISARNNRLILLTSLVRKVDTAKRVRPLKPSVHRALLV